MFNKTYKTKLEKLKNKKNIEKELFQKLLYQYKKDGDVSETANIKINKIIESYDLVINEIEEFLNSTNEEDITKETFNEYKIRFKKILENK